MSAPWQITSGTVAAGSQATASQAVTTNEATSGMVTRLRTICASLVGTGGVATGTLVIADGASATSALAVWTIQMACVSGGGQIIHLADMDVRASVGNSLTVGFIAGGGGAIVQAVSATGDLVPVGAPAFYSNV